MIRIGEWERGFAFWPSERPDLRMYLWFYEWNLFDAVCPGQHTSGYWIPTRTITAEHDYGELSHPGLFLTVQAREDGAELTLHVTNESSHPWPHLAAIIPCFNPGGSDTQGLVPRTPQFFDDSHNRTWFAGRDGPKPLEGRDIHFNQGLRSLVDMEADHGRFVFSEKWPTSSENAGVGLLVRESVDGEWATGIGWEEFVSVQGHNPWRCMHAAVRLGPLGHGQSKTINGRMYLLKGTKEACFRAFSRDLMGSG